ncbi:hypothetical protein PR202_ga14094 [Eleusine coracana subsp. coracana]|uniref:J domain-containing protein n=1 Tax=Eleusine coracana subsp. coracana TaxID=191504 RepID=A0AAV5CGL5_ELECO|nr:hypothetical protein PR202_ga14094 [Eleusine coracana subsp. coracana]
MCNGRGRQAGPSKQEKSPLAVTRTHEEIKKQYRRLCLVLHPDKNRSAAAEGAFKLIHQAWEHLSAHHKPGGPPLPCTTEPDEPDNFWWSAFGSGGRRTGGPPPRHEYDEFWEDEPGFDGDSSSRPAPPPPSARRSRSWQPRYARSRGHVFCGNCGSSNFDENEKSDEACRSCFGRVRRHHHQSKAGSPPAPPAAPAQKANNNKPPPRRPRKPRSSVPIFCEKGKWRLEQLGDQHTLLKYMVETKMHKDTFLSESILEEVIYEDLPSNLCAIRDYIEKAGAEDSDFTTHSAAPTDTSVKQRPKVPGLQKDIEVLKSELEKFIAKYGQNGFMPKRKHLRSHGRVDIEKAITRMGGFRKIASIMNLSLSYKNRKPKDQAIPEELGYGPYIHA